ncbi:MAG: glycoside hydrolase family 99-like domain-containing protein [Bacteroidaceae bacterium]|nr:glycoside hydrolase family 99-like domain-containing protein [Bacteroidaceae bacterium]
MKARVIALYLPQFHPIPENDLWWGPGFTEWTNVAKAKPLFRGHIQPKIPADLGFYDLRLPETREQQASMARQAGIEGFCYYHYWFGNGKQLLERPFDEVLESGKPDFPFCLCWANHDWTNKTWTNQSALKKDSMMIKMEYSMEDHKNHFFSLLPAFKDKRYITVDGKPLFMIYNAIAFPQVKEYIELWKGLARENGLPGIYFVGGTQSTFSFRLNDEGKRIASVPNLKSSAEIFNSVLEMGFDAVNSFGKRRGEMLEEGRIKYVLRVAMQKIGIPMNKKYDYLKTVSGFFAPEDNWENVFPTILPQWDRSPRVGSADGVYVNATPENFKKHIFQALDLVKDKQEEHRIIFMKSWNEWGEGNYVEPDQIYGHGFLDALAETLK